MKFDCKLRMFKFDSYSSPEIFAILLKDKSNLTNDNPSKFSI